MCTRLSHVKVFAATILLLLLRAAHAEDYLLTLIVNGQSHGEYVVSRQGEADGLGSPELFRAIGVPAAEPLPLTQLTGLGSYRIVWAEQKIFFYPRTFSATNSQRLEPEATVEAPPRALDAKSLDFYLAYQSRVDRPLSGAVLGTGRVGSFDLDLRAGIGGHESYVSSQWHDEESSRLRDVQLGRVQRYGLDGIAITNERTLATAMFGRDMIELYWPVGTRVDVYRGGEFIDSFVIEQSPQPYEVELTYAANRYAFRAILSNGKIETREVERSVSGRLAPVGQPTYSLSAGRENGTGENRLIGNIGVGITPNLSLFTGRDALERGFLSALYSAGPVTVEPIWLGGAGWSLNGNLDLDRLSLFGQHSEIHGNRLTSTSIALRTWGSPTLSYRNSVVNAVTLREATLRTHHGLQLPRLGHLSISPHVQRRSLNDTDATVLGGRALANLRYGWQVVGRYERERQTKSRLTIQRGSFEVSKRLPLGRIAYRQEYIDYGGGSFDTLQQSLRMDIWQWRYLALSAAAIRAADGDTSLQLSISGSLDRGGLRRTPQQHQASMLITACLDRSLDGICQDEEDEITGMPVVLNGQRYTTPAYVADLTPYRPYEIELGADFGLSPRYSAVSSSALVRGAPNRMRLPVSEVVELEGQIPSGQDGVAVSLVHAETGAVLSEQRTALGGWYLFYAPAHVPVKVEAR